MRKFKRIMVVTLMVFGMAGYGAYADDPSGEGTVQQNAEDSPGKTTETPEKKTESPDVIEKQTEKATEKVTEKQTEKATEKVTEKQTEKATEKVTEKQTEKNTEKVTEKQTEKATEKVTEKQTEKNTEKVTEKQTEKATEKVTEKKTEKKTEKDSEKDTEKKTTRPTESPETDPSDEPVEDPSEEPSEDPSTEDTEDPTGESTEESTEEPEMITITVTQQIYSQEELELLREMHEQSQNEVSLAEEKLQQLRMEKNRFVANMQEMDEMIIDLQDRMNNLTKKQQEVSESIARLTLEMDKTRKEEAEHYERMKEHIRNAYENGNYSYVDALLSASSFVELLNKPEYVQEVSEYDCKLLEEYRTIKRKIADQMMMLKTVQEGAGIMEETYANQQQALEVMKAGKEEQILYYEQTVDEESVNLTKLQKLEISQASEIADIEEKARATITYQMKPYDGGIFMWPQPSSTYITSDYGYRGDIGIPGASKDHKGIDISANMYDPVIAAAPGTVIYTGYYGTGGKTVMIDIGGAITIIYHHLNDYAVATGDTVEAGQVVGHVGMTGVTGGPHLHFSVRVNGQYVNPRPYLGLPLL